MGKKVKLEDIGEKTKLVCDKCKSNFYLVKLHVGEEAGHMCKCFKLNTFLDLFRK